MPGNSPEMSPATRDILMKVRKMVPPMLEKFHKGRAHSTTTLPVTNPLTTLRTNGTDSSYRRK